MSNIIIRARYHQVKDINKNISGWLNYVGKKDKADGTSLDTIGVNNDYFTLLDQDSHLLETSESFIWDSNGNVNPKVVKGDKIKIDDKSIVWNLVISFPSDFAINNGLVTKSDYYSLTQNIIPSLITDMGLKLDKTLWYASLHRNTKNPHMHILLCEKVPTVEKGYIPKSVITKLKSNIGNHLIDNSKFYILRAKEFSNITGGIDFKDLAKIQKQKLFSDSYRRELNKKLLNLYNKLPPRGRLQYNSDNLKFIKEDLDDVIKFILLHDTVKYSYANYLKLLDKHQKDLNALYGLSNDNLNKKYYNEQLNRLYTKIGNDILSNFKTYQSKELMNKEKDFLNKNILEMNFKSNSNYIKEESKIKVAKDLYKICSLANLNYNDTKKVFSKWIKKSKYDYDVEDLIALISTLDTEMSSTDFYKSLKRLGYDYKRYTNLKNKNFYKELNYKLFMNKAFNHLLYEHEKEEKELVENIRYDLEGY